MLSVRRNAARRGPDVSKMCWSCALKQQRAWLSLSSSPSPSPSPSSTSSLTLSSPLTSLARGCSISSTRLISSTRTYPSRRLYTAQAQLKQQLDPSHSSDPPVFNPAIHSLNQTDDQDQPQPISRIRQELQKWHEEHGHENLEPVEDLDVNEAGEATNNFTRLGDVDNFRRPDETQQNERDDLSQITQSNLDELEDFDPNHRFLRRGDLVELEFPRSERESIIAIFVRRVGSPPQSQFYTVHGKWIHATERQVQFALPNFMHPALIEPIIPFLPDTGITEELMDKAQMFDLSVPRSASAPVVSQMLEFQRRAEDIYRRHASTLDSAHHTLAHPTDLKFGTLDLIAHRLLDSVDGKSLKDETRYAVRKALHRGGFAFGFDRRSHRLTGFIQIRSKEQVANIERVRGWLRAWQDDLALFAAATRPHFQYSDKAQLVVDFIEKARRLIATSRESRDVTPYGRIGPSKIRFDINKQQTVQYHYSVPFSDEDRELIKFMEGWCTSGIFLGLPRMESLPPLILQATGMYDDLPLTHPTGFVFLQEIGVLSPHENRVRSDTHLLLPSSQHSKPLEKLMTKILSMRGDANLVDSMADLRKDWGDLRVFCIDGEGAHEIDDGVSLESAENGDHWVHVHIANPTAFFDNGNAMAKMARHMTETIYMPERAFGMLPQWATKDHFSLNNNRPCLTFSARLDANGKTVEHKIQPGFVRNVKFVSPHEASKVVGVDNASRPDVVLTVGGQPPHRPAKKTADRLTESDIAILKTLQNLAEKRQTRRRLAGGLFLDSQRPEIAVWVKGNHPGIGWEHPSRTAARRVDGDPIIEFRSKELISWFSSEGGVSDILVREMMLLACQIGSEWCAERGIPAIHRGTMENKDTMDPKKFYDEILAPAIEKNNDEAPMHLAIEYLRNTGSTVLTTTPLHHRVLGLPHYTKATSPLRRYGDMVLHWQIESALRIQANEGKPFLQFEGKRLEHLAFNERNLQTIAQALQPRESMIRRATTYAEEFWLATLFFRAHHYGECELPSTFTAYLSSVPPQQSREVSILIKEYSCVGTMTKPEHFGLTEAMAGDWWEVKLDYVNVYERKILFQPIRLISRWT